MTNQVLRDVEIAIDPMSALQFNVEEIEKDVFFRTPTRRCGTPVAITGAPTTGTWQLNQIYRDSDLVEWICTVAGTPGTWVRFSNTNFANTDLTFTGDRLHNADGFDLSVTNAANIVLSGDGTSTATGGNGAIVAGGENNTSSDYVSATLGGEDNTASGEYSSVVGGYSHTASGDNSAIIGGHAGVASAVNAIVIGGDGGAAVLRGQVVLSAVPYLVAGDRQSHVLTIAGFTSGATTNTIDLGGGVGGAPVIQPAGSVWLVEQTIVGMTVSAGKVATYIRRYTTSRPTNAASTVLLGSVQVVGTDTGTNAGAPPAVWGVAITADTTNGGPKTVVTGDTGDDILWGASLKVNQVVFNP